jgi:ankyrin repeat protein
VTEPRRGAQPEGASQAANYALSFRRGSQMPSAAAVPHETALHGAAARGLNDFVKFLADHGADLQAKDANGRTPLDLAKGTGTAGRGQAESFPETVKLLESLIAARGTAQSPAR